MSIEIAKSLGLDLCQIPATAQWPEGVKPNFEDPFSLAPTMFAVSILLTFWATLFASARIWVNRKTLDIGDYLIILGILWHIGFTGLILSQHRFYRHQWNVPACWFDGQYMKIIFVITFLYTFIGFCKAAILLMYLKLFSVSNRMRIAVWIGLVFDFVVYFPSIPMSIYYEVPRGGQTWGDMVEKNKDVQTSVLVPLGIATGAASVLLDIYIFVLPLPIITRLQIDWSKKLQLVLVFTTALLGVVASIIALVYRVQLIDENDLSWQQGRFYICMIVENAIVIIVACMPAFAKFTSMHIITSSVFKSLQSRLRGTTGSGAPSSSKQNSPRAVLQTFGSPQKKSSSDSGYYELDERKYGRSQCTVESKHNASHDSHWLKSRTGGPEEDETAILKTMDVYQQREYPGQKV